MKKQKTMQLEIEMLQTNLMSTLSKLANHETMTIPNLEKELMEKENLVNLLFRNYLSLEELYKQKTSENPPQIENREKYEKIHQKFKIKEELLKNEEEKRRLLLEEEEKKKRLILEEEERKKQKEEEEKKLLEEKKDEIFSNKIIKEILSTEQTYVDSLAILVKDYLEPLKKNAFDDKLK